MGLHRNIPVGLRSSHPPGFVQSGDPGAVGAYKVWVDTSAGTGLWVTKVRNAADTGWETVGSSSGVSAYPALFDVPPSSAHASDDEFIATSLAGGWTNPAVTANPLTITVGGGWLRFESSDTGTADAGGRFHGIYKASPAGSFSISAKLAAGASVTGTDSYDGLMVGVTGGKGHVFGIGRNGAYQLAAIGATTYGEGATDWSTFDTYNIVGAAVGAVIDPAWYRIRWDATATTLYWDYSYDGAFWINWQSRAAMSQPDRMGLGMYATSNVTYADKAMAASRFRVTEP